MTIKVNFTKTSIAYFDTFLMKFFSLVIKLYNNSLV